MTETGENPESVKRNGEKTHLEKWQRDNWEIVNAQTALAIYGVSDCPYCRKCIRYLKNHPNAQAIVDSVMRDIVAVMP